MAYSSMAKGSKQPLAELVDEIPILDDFFEEHSIPEYIDDSTFLDPDPMLKMTVDGLFDTEHSKRPLDDFPLPDQCYERQSTVGYGDGSSVMLPPSGLLGDDQAEVDYPQMASVNIHSDIIMRDSVFQEDDILEEVNYSSFTPPRPIPYTAKQYQNDDETCFSYASTWEGSDWLASEDTTYGSYDSMSSVPLTQASSESPSNPSDLLTFYVAPKPNSPPAESALSALIAEQRRSKNGSGTASTAFEVGPGRKTNLAPNDFDVALTDFSTLPTHPSTLCTPASQTSLGWLDQWLKQNQSRLPSQRELQCLEGLTNLSGPFITNWLTQHSTTTSHLPKEENSSRSRVSIDDSTPQKKINYSSSTSSYSCLPCSSRPWQPTNPTSQPPPSSCPSNSCKPRPHSTKPLSPSSIPPTTKPNPPPVLYSCTQNCGFTTPRRHDWSRHERKRFEEWICPTPLCNASLTRKEKLRDHLRVVHGRGSSAPKSLDQCRREKQEGGGEGGKACGFCGRGFAEWKAWLGHVGDHFEADARGTSSAAAA